jgi:lysophospholipase L1-like esterase
MVALAAVALSACGLESSFPTGAPSPVFILETAGLQPPAIGQKRIYIPKTRFSAPTSDSVSEDFVVFQLTVATGSPDITLLLKNRETSEETTLVHVPAPSTNISLNQVSQLLNESPLLANQASQIGLYWAQSTAGVPDVEASLTTLLTVVLPTNQLEPFMELVACTHHTEDGTPIMADSIELVHDFFYLAALGDSVQWGNGLHDKDKIYALVASTIESETDRRVISQIHALSGATIIPPEDDGVCELNCSGEVPSVWTSITTQVSLVASPETVDLVLLTGCANDIGISVAFAPDAGVDGLQEKANTYCYEAMKDLLELVHATMPQATVVVMGYYQALSEDTRWPDVQEWVKDLGLPSASMPALDLESAVANAAIIDQFTTYSLSQAVEAANAEVAEDEPFLFAAPQFAPENALMASEPWVFGLSPQSPVPLPADLDLGLEIFPQDSMFRFRLNWCFKDDVAPNPFLCLYASVGHPNESGARAYAYAVVQELRRKTTLLDPDQ